MAENAEASYLKISKNNKPLEGTIEMNGDSLISQYALILLALGTGTATIRGVAETEDVKITIETLRKLGINLKKNGKIWEIVGSGLDGLHEPNDVINIKNSINSLRLFTGLLSNRDFTSFFTAEEKIRSTNLDYLLEPLRLTGAQLTSRNFNKLPLAIKGTKHLCSMSYSSQSLVRQIKDSLLIANLNNEEEIVIKEEKLQQNHLEIMMRYLGIDLNIKDIDTGNRGEIGKLINFNGKQEYNNKNLSIPGDISLASFIIVAALIVPGSKIKIENVCVNSTRTALYKTLVEMGAKIEFLNQRIAYGEKVADISIRYGELRGKVLTPGRCLSMVNDLAVLTVIAACANGVTKINGLDELEDEDFANLETIVQNLEKFNVETKLKRGSLEIVGNKFSKKYTEPIVVADNGDYRIGLAFSLLGNIIDGMVIWDHQNLIDANFPDFIDLFTKLGGRIE